jgi:hypothetical protein
VIWSMWSFILRRLAKAQGFLDPVAVFSNLQRFSQPSEVWVPTELLRSGAVLQARGLINSQAIQHNLDWVWPFWVEQQFNPQNEAFIPRAFSMTHINLTHRNWTAIGLPDYHEMPIVDPCGLLTPFFDGWSIDAWLVSDHLSLIPSRVFDIEQKIHFNDELSINTISKLKNSYIETNASIQLDQNNIICNASFKAQAPTPTWLVISVRPYNPEGISFVHEIECLPDKEGWLINGKESLHLHQTPSEYVFSNYHLGDIYQQLVTLCSSNYSATRREPRTISCPVGMASAAAIYELKPNTTKEVNLSVPLSKVPKVQVSTWKDQLENHCELRIPDEKFKFLFDIALRMMILHAPDDVYPGPFTYKRFWFRDAAYILNAMITVGLLKNIEKIIDRFPIRQKPSGYFMSQDGEWDSNGQAIWIIQRYIALTQKPLKEEWRQSVYHAARWIQWRRLPTNKSGDHAGLMPAGFSAEHFGPSNFYYWDDFWSVAGLKAASILAQKHPDLSKRFNDEALDLMHSIEKSLRAVQGQFSHLCIPASPNRRMDGGAIGSMVVSYPLQLWPSHDKRILDTADYLMSKHFLHGCFYHEISHSGLNVYLTLHVAQVLLRASDPKFFNIVEAVAQLATSTGQWPEAIHPKTKGGCMGDGQHMWAAAEWVLMIRNMFVREEIDSKTLILCSGIPAAWLQPNETLFLGPTLTEFGKISVWIKVGEDIEISWEADWHGEAPNIEIHLQGHPRYTVKDDAHLIKMKHNPSALIVF